MPTFFKSKQILVVFESGLLRTPSADQSHRIVKRFRPAITVAIYICGNRRGSSQCNQGRGGGQLTQFGDLVIGVQKLADEYKFCCPAYTIILVRTFSLLV